MYFVNNLHRTNYEHLITEVYPHAKEDKEYHVLAYIFALPEVYNRCINDIFLKSFPFLWTVKYRLIPNTEENSDTGEKYSVIDFEVEEDEEGNGIRSEAYYELSSGYQKLVELAENLFNSHNVFNLMNALGTWDDTLFKVFLQAVLIRKGNREIDGLTIHLG
jgi:hypothetical protein